MEMYGMQLDAAKVKEEFTKFNKELADVNHELHTFTGGVNPNSPKQVCEYVYNVLGFEPLKNKGKEVRSADADTLSRLKATTADQAHFLALKSEQARLHAACSKALNKFQACCDAGKLLLGQFNQCVTATHRLSASGTEFGVQFQNMAREFKSLFKSRNEGWDVVEIDGAQIEFRVAAFLGQDYVAWLSIHDGEDVHSFTAKTLTAAGQKTERQEAKSHTFKPLYGGQSGTKAEKAYYKAFREKYPGIAKAQLDWQYEVLRTGKLTLASGLKLYFTGTSISSDGYITNSTQICNYPVQSLATAEITLIAITRLWHYMHEHEMQAFMVNTVHDSVVCEVPPKERELLYDLSVKAFTEYVYQYLNEVYNMKFNVPLGLGFKAGSHWSTGKEVKIQVDPPFDPPEK
jgi:DNA polymerase I-like protein with 3'-5' exonuclease and polymerase domains